MKNIFHCFKTYEENDNVRIQRMLDCMSDIIHSEFMTNEFQLTSAGLDFVHQNHKEFVNDYKFMVNKGHVFGSEIDNMIDKLGDYDSQVREDLQNQLQSQQHPSKYSELERFSMMANNLISVEVDPKPDYNKMKMKKTKDDGEPEGEC